MTHFQWTRFGGSTTFVIHHIVAAQQCGKGMTLLEKTHIGSRELLKSSSFQPLTVLCIALLHYSHYMTLRYITDHMCNIVQWSKVECYTHLGRWSYNDSQSGNGGRYFIPIWSYEVGEQNSQHIPTRSHELIWNPRKSQQQVSSKSIKIPEKNPRKIPLPSGFYIQKTNWKDPPFL